MWFVSNALTPYNPSGFGEHLQVPELILCINAQSFENVSSKQLSKTWHYYLRSMYKKICVNTIMYKYKWYSTY